MRKFLISLLAVLFIMTGSYALACEGPECYGSGNFNIDSNAGDYGQMYQGIFLPKAKAFSDTSGIGNNNASAYGDVRRNGTASGDITSIGGGVSEATAGTYVPEDLFGNPLGDRRVGVETSGFAQGVTGGSVDLTASADRVDGRNGHGEARGNFGGQASIWSSSTSKVWKDFSNYTYGQANLNGSGSVYGDAHVHADSELQRDRIFVGFKYIRIPFTRCYIPIPVYRTVYTVRNEEGTAGAAGLVDMYGNTYSSSYGFVASKDGANTEGGGSFAAMDLNVTSFGTKYDTGNAHSHASINGGWNVSGGVNSVSTQQSNYGSAYGQMNAGINASGRLGCDFTGSAQGYTYSTMTNFDGMNGGINTAGAGASISVGTSFDNSNPADVDPQ